MDNSSESSGGYGGGYGSSDSSESSGGYSGSYSGGYSGGYGGDDSDGGYSGGGCSSGDDGGYSDDGQSDGSNAYGEEGDAATGDVTTEYGPDGSVHAVDTSTAAQVTYGPDGTATEQVDTPVDSASLDWTQTSISSPAADTLKEGVDQTISVVDDACQIAAAFVTKRTDEMIADRQADIDLYTPDNMSAEATGTVTTEYGPDGSVHAVDTSAAVEPDAAQVTYGPDGIATEQVDTPVDPASLDWTQTGIFNNSCTCRRYMGDEQPRTDKRSGYEYYRRISSGNRSGGYGKSYG